MLHPDPKPQEEAGASLNWIFSKNKWINKEVV
jgi:hypothetical protein